MLPTIPDLLRDNGLPDDEGMVLVQLDDGSVELARSLEEADWLIDESRKETRASRH
jgi:hypothetical protein